MTHDGERTSDGDEPAGLLSDKPIPAGERLIAALDVPTAADAIALVETLGGAVDFYKVGLELVTGGGYREVVEELRRLGKRIFLDLKLFDVPETVASAVRQLQQLGIDFVTVHGNEEMMQAAVRERGSVKVLAVTVLTSLDQKDLADLGFEVNIEELVLSRARRALDAGCDGVISSGVEVPALRRALGDQLVVVSPGIRPVVNRTVDDQKRTVDVEEAFRNGADYIVVGRPIRQAADPAGAALDIRRRIEKVFGGDT